MSRRDLLDESETLVLSKTLALALGLRESIVLRRLAWWLKFNEDHQKKDSHWRDGSWWAYNTITQWMEHDFPFWSHNTIERIFDGLAALA
jgi:hypothetical protein